MEEFSLIRWLYSQMDWSRRTYGPGKRTIGITKHIQKECDEIRARPHDLEEWADVVILGLDGAWRMGATPEQICVALQAKQDKNMARQWPAPTSQDEPVEHVRSAEDTYTNDHEGAV